MKKIAIALACLISAATPIRAQFVVSDPGVETATAAIAASIDIANADLAAIMRSTQAIATTTAETFTMMSTPTIIEGRFAGLDGGARLNIGTTTAEFMVALAGLTSVSPLATEILTQQTTDLSVDERQGQLTGNSEDAEATRQRTTGTNLQAFAYSDLRAYAARFTAADELEAQLSTAKDIKQAITWNGGIEIQSLKTLNLIGVSISLNTAAIIESRLQIINETKREKDDHQQTALQFAVAP